MSRHRGPRGQEAQGVLGAAMHEVVGMNVVPARDLGNDRLGRQELPIRSFSANVHRRRRSGPESTVTVIAFAH